MQLVMRPDNLTDGLENLYGDIVSDLCAGLIGGLGLAPGANIGEQARFLKPFPALRPTSPVRASPTRRRIMMSAFIMLRHLGEMDAAHRAENAMMEVFAEGEIRTRDLGGTSSTADFANAIIDKLKK